MLKKKLRFTALDFVLILVILFIGVYAFLRSVGMGFFNDENVIKDTVITLSVKGVERNNFQLFNVGDSVDTKELGRISSIGLISELRSSPAVIVGEGDGGFEYVPDFTCVDLFADVASECTVDRNGFFTIGGVCISPGMTFDADNGKIKFLCEVVSVRIAE